MQDLIRYVTKEKKLRMSNITKHMSLTKYESYSRRAMERTDFVLYFFRTKQTEEIFQSFCTDASNVYLLHRDNYMTMQLNKSDAKFTKMQRDRVDMMISTQDPPCVVCGKTEIVAGACRECNAICCLKCSEKCMFPSTEWFRCPKCAILTYGRREVSGT
jgi:hypothetical protein